MSNSIRRKTKVVEIGNLRIGGNNPIAIQSMAKVKTEDIKAAVKQINELESFGCEIVRLAIKDIDDAKALKEVKNKTNIPLVADIHFNYRLALEAINSGVDKIRLNPGNIYKKEEVCKIARAAKLNRIPIRVGINSGSLESPRHKDWRVRQEFWRNQVPAKNFGGTRSPFDGVYTERSRSAQGRQGHNFIADRMVKSALDYIRMLEGVGFDDIVVSLKASNTVDTINAYRKMADSCNYPLHLGVTATGLPFSGAMKSSVAIGILLFEGIGDTIRVSLTDKPQVEVKVAKAILEALGLRSFGPDIISCPTCGRCEVDLMKLVNEFEKKLNTVNCKLLTVNSQPVRVAMMGCVVNGPGEAKEADIGVAFGKKEGLLFKKGRPVKKIAFDDCVDVLLKEISKGHR